MNRKELTNYLFDYWKVYSNSEQLYETIYSHLGTLEGTEKELDYCCLEFDDEMNENSLRYKTLCEMWERLNNYKTMKEKEEI